MPSVLFQLRLLNIKTCPEWVVSMCVCVCVCVMHMYIKLMHACGHVRAMHPLTQLCSLYPVQDQEGRTAAVIIAIATEVEAHCRCGFTTAIISSPLFRCFPQSTNAVTLRARLIDSTLLSAVQDWVQASGLIPVQSILIEVDRTCQVAISSLADTECISELITTSSPSTTMIANPVSSNDNSVAVIGGVVGVVIVLIIAITIAVIVVAVLQFKSKKDKLVVGNLGR